MGLAGSLYRVTVFMELWDIYDEKGRPTGRTHPRGTPQQPGEYHLVCTVVFANSKGELLCTHRAPEKDLCPNMWESPGGGVRAGETSLFAAIREIREEIGLTLAPSQLTLLYRDKRNDFFMDTYGVKMDFPADSLRFQPGETDGAKWISLEEWERLAAAGEILTPAKGDLFPILRAFVREADSSLRVWIRENGDEALREKILALKAIPWPELSADPWPEREHLASFCRMEGERLAAHGAVAGTSFTHKGERYFACGVAEVATHPDFQGRGYALSLLRRMNTDIQRRQADLCVFTCQPSLVPLYEKAGWTPCPDLCLTGGSAEKPFPSSSLGLTVMLSLLSPKAIAHGADFRNTAITLPLGENKLW